MYVSSPSDHPPELDGVSSPSVLYDEDAVLVCYRSSHRVGAENVILQFLGVAEFTVAADTVQRIGEYHRDMQPYAVNEIHDSEAIKKWTYFRMRMWAMSFNDVTIYIVFEQVKILRRGRPGEPLRATLAACL